MANYKKLLLKMLVSTVSELTESNKVESARGDSAKSVNKQKMQQPTGSAASVAKRRLVGAVAAAFLLTAALGHWTEVFKTWTGSASTSDFLVSAMTRMGMVFGAMWLAWDSLRRPARWLPPGLAVLGVISIVAIAAQPKLIFAILPLVGTVAVVTALLRLFRRE